MCFSLGLFFCFSLFFIRLLYEKATYPNPISGQLMSFSKIFLLQIYSQSQRIKPAPQRLDFCSVISRNAQRLVGLTHLCLSQHEFALKSNAYLWLLRWSKVIKSWKCLQNLKIKWITIKVFFFLKRNSFIIYFRTSLLMTNC